MLVDETENGSPSALLLDRIVELDCVEQLKSLIEGDYSAEVKIQAINLLLETGAGHPVEKYVQILCDANEDEGLKELCVETLTTMPNEVSALLYPLIPTADYTLKGLIAEILVGAEKDERIYELLQDLFENGNNVSLYAGFIAKYGDERAMTYLYKALDNCNYADYTEIRNAIESLGGTVDDEYRDFSSDPYYKALKNIK
jgi:HEAT repeat protein